MVWWGCGCSRREVGSGELAAAAEKLFNAGWWLPGGAQGNGWVLVGCGGLALLTEVVCSGEILYLLYSRKRVWFPWLIINYT